MTEEEEINEVAFDLLERMGKKPTQEELINEMLSAYISEAQKHKHKNKKQGENQVSKEQRRKWRKNDRR